MTVVGEAYVDVRAIGKKFRSDLKRILDQGIRDADVAGNEAGDRFGTSFGESLREAVNSSIGDVFDDALSQIDALSSEIENRLGGLNVGGGTFDGLQQDINDTNQQVDELDNSFTRFLSSLRSGGGGGGRGGIFGWLTEGAEQASQRLTTLVAVGNVVFAGLTPLIGALGAVGSSLLSLAAAAAAALPSLIVLPGILGALLQGGIALAVGFRGVGGALSAGLESLNRTGAAGTRAATAALSNARAIEAAQRRLRDAYQRSADSAEDSAERVADAERTLAQAINASRIAQEGLNAAREEAAERLQQLAFSAEDAILSEERAALSLESAYATLQSVASLPPDNRTRREAELAFKEAELNYRQAKDRNADLAKEQEAAARAGVEGSREVVDAKNDIAEAENRVLEAQEAVAEALRDQSRAARDAAEGIADAQRALELAYASAASANAAAAGSVNKYAQELAKLSPAQREFVKLLVSLNPLFIRLRDAVADGLFPPVTKALKELTSDTSAGSFFGNLLKFFGQTGEVLGKFLASLLKVLDQLNFTNLLQTNVRVLSALGDGFVALADVILFTLDAARPFIAEFAEWFRDLAKGWQQVTEGEAAFGRFRNAIGESVDVFKVIAGAVKAFFGAMRPLLDTALPGGLFLIRRFTEAMQNLRKEVRGDKEGFTDFFSGAAKNAAVFIDVLGEIGRAIFSIADDKGIADTAEAFRPLAPILRDAGAELVKAGPAFARAVVSVANLIKAFAGSGAITTFFNVISGVAGFLADAFSTGIGQRVLAIAGGIFAVTRSFKLLTNIGQFFLKGTLGALIVGFGKLKGALGFGGGGGLFETLKKIPGALRKFITGEKASSPATKFINDFADNLEKLAKQFDVTGAAKDRFIVNLKKLSRAFDDAGGSKPTSGVAQKAGRIRDGQVSATVGRSDLPSANEQEGFFKRLKASLGGRLSGTGGAQDDAKSRDGLFKRLLARLPRGDRSGGDEDDRRRPRGDRGSARVGGLAKLGGLGALGALLPLLLDPSKLAGIGEVITKIVGNIPVLIGTIAKELPKIITTLVKAIGPVIKSIVSAFPKIIDSVVKALPGLIKTIVGAIPQVIGALAAALPRVIDALAGAIPLLINGLSKALPKIVSAISKAIPKVLDGIVSAIPGILNAILSLLPAIISLLTDALPRVLIGLLKAIPQVIQALAKALPIIIQGILKAVPEIIKGLTAALPEVIKALADAIPLIITAIIQAVPLIITAVVQAAPQIVQAVIGIVPAIVQSLIAALPAIFEPLSGEFITKIGDMLSSAVESGKAILEGIVTWFGELPSKISGFISTAFDWLVTAAKNVTQRVINLFIAYVEWYIGLPGKLLSAAGDVFGWLGEKARAAVEWVKDKLVGSENSLLSFVKALPGKISDAASGMWDGFTDAFKSAINGIIRIWNSVDFEIGGWVVPGPGPERLRTLPKINVSLPNIPTLGDGGTVAATNGGVLALLAEAGGSERVTPLDSNGLSAGERAVLAAIKQLVDRDPVVAVQVLLGTREIEDIVGMTVNGKAVQTVRQNTYSRPVR